MLEGDVLARARQTPSDGVLFGQKQLHPESMWPCHEKLQRLGRYKEMTLASIQYRCLHDSYELTAIQLCFTNGEKTPLFETKASSAAGEMLKTIRVAQTCPIKKISVKGQSGFIDGLRLTDEKGHVIVDECWNILMKDSTEWSTYEIPAGQEIVGIYCHAKALQVIPCLGFILRAKPKASKSELLNDLTKIAGTTWSELKDRAMQEDYKEQSWFANLSAVQKSKLEDLREA